jgi:hypothetical protein
MSKKIAGVIVEFNHRGGFNILTDTFEVLKETPKMYKIDSSKGLGSCVGYVDNIRKADLGRVTKPSCFSTAFSFQCTDVVKSGKTVEKLVSELINKARDEIRDRNNLIHSWNDNLNKYVLEKYN